MMLSFPPCFHYMVEFSVYLIQGKIFGQVLWLTSGLGGVGWLPVWLLLLRKEIRLWIREHLHKSLIARKLSSLEKACLFRTCFWDKKGSCWGCQDAWCTVCVVCLHHLCRVVMILCIHQMCFLNPKGPAGAEPPLWHMKRMEPAVFKGRGAWGP